MMYHLKALTMSNDDTNTIIVRPGQLWRWTFSVGDGSWLFENVSEERRRDAPHSWSGNNSTIVHTSDLFTVISVDDPGPCVHPQLDTVINVDSCNYVLEKLIKPPARWHVAMLFGTLVWIEHHWFNEAELICEHVERPNT